MLSPRPLLPLLAIAALSAACVGKTGSIASDSSGAEDVAGTESDVESLGASFIAGDGQSVATQALVADAACLQVTTDAVNQTAQYDFDGCTGRLGLVELTGRVLVKWQAAGGQLTLEYAAQGFHIHRATVDWQGTAVVTASGDQRTMAWSAQLDGTTGRGRPFSRIDQKTVSWTVGVECLSVDGQSTGNILGARLQTTVTSWRRCADACPQAGSEIQVQNLDEGDSIDIRYEGGPSGELTVDGRSETIGLACGD